MVRVKGFEPLTAWFVARYSIQLSYTRRDILLFLFSIQKSPFRANRKMVRVKGFEPLTAWFVARYSIQLSYTRFKNLFVTKWRRRRDSNPRTSYKLVTPLAGERLRPLGHPSVFLLALIILSYENKSNFI